MIFYEVGHHLHGCHPKMVRTHVQHWQLQYLHLFSHLHTPVIVDIVQHKDSFLSPLGVLPIEMDAQLGQKETKGICIGNSNIYGVEEFPCTA